MLGVPEMNWNYSNIVGQSSRAYPETNDLLLCMGMAHYLPLPVLRCTTTVTFINDMLSINVYDVIAQIV